ncbi:TRAP transporter small permease [uncultured Sphaerochaeta sp.]|uniref:TRAP transporter small permease n=1 Tax=uncultured Sphaerochaeta sp. TaxID=886478 RepID=UPI002A0A77E3|nr:TRAP transporter small permease [uncultured Sphaerochaeta sp.]
MKVIKKILDGFVKVVSVLLMCLVAGIVLLMLNELFLRNFLDKSFSGMTELAGFMFLWMAFLGIIVLYDQNRLISLDMIFIRTKEPLTTIFWFLHKLIAMCLGLIMIISFVGLYPFISTEFFSSMPHFAKVWQYLPLAIVGVFLCLKSVYEILEKIHTLKKPELSVSEVSR